MRTRSPERRACLALTVALWLPLAQGPAFAAVDLEVRKTVDNAVPSAGEVANFTIEVRNAGTDTAREVHVQDRLPAGLGIPAGLAAFPASGSYDPASGDWNVGDLEAGASTRLVIPALVSTPQMHACLVNRAEAQYVDDPVPANNRAVAAVRRSVDARCVDMAAEVTSVRLGSTTCSSTNRFSAEVEVTNRGPDRARDVVIDLSQRPVVAPDLRFTRQLGGPSASCAGTRCTVESVAAGETVRLLAESGNFRLTRETAVTLTVAVATADADYAPADDEHERRFTVPGLDGCVGVGGSSDEGACIVVAALRDSQLERYVATVRHFRDRHLVNSVAGRDLLRAYYRLSPAATRLVAGHEWLRPIARLLLAPAVLAIAYPLAAVALVLLVATPCCVMARRARRAGGAINPGSTAWFGAGRTRSGQRRRLR